MDKIIVRDIQNIHVKKDSYICFDFLEKNGEIKIDVDSDVVLTIFEISRKSKINYEYFIKEKAKVNVNRLLIDSNGNLIINMVGNNSNIKYVNSVISSNSNDCYQNINHKCSSTKSEIYNNIINLNGDFTIKVDAKVDDNIVDSITRQDNKIINLGNGNNKIIPNLLINNDSVNASHSAYIGKFNKEHIFYLQSRGLSLNDIYNLLVTGILMGNMEVDDDDRSYMINEIKIYLQEVNYES